jgi:hypothetical protein
MADTAGVKQSRLQESNLPSSITFGVELELICASLQPADGLLRVQQQLDGAFPHAAHPKERWR